MATQVRFSQNPCQAQAHLYSTMKVIILLSFKRREKHFVVVRNGNKLPKCVVGVILEMPKK